MTNSKLLKKKINEAGFTISSLAPELGITRQGLSKKINNRSRFWNDEMEKICKKLNIQNKEKAPIFFAVDVDKMETSNINPS